MKKELKDKKVCSIYKSPMGIMTIVNSGYYVTNILYGNYSSDFYFNQNDTINQRVISELQEYFEGSRKTFDLPIRFEDKNITDFQKKVWYSLMKIPYGETRTYSEIANDINKPTAIRAIGTATSKNPIAIIIPSHRVVTANGNLAGYNGGINAKKKLLDLEKSVVASINQKLIRENRASSELINIALHSTNIYEFYFYPVEKIEIFPNRTAQHYGLPTKFENSPESFFNDFVFYEDKEVYFNMFNEILCGKQSATAIYRNKEGTNWYRVILSTAEYDENNNPITVVGISEDITKDKEIEFEKNNLITIHNEILSSVNDMFVGIHRLDLKNGTIKSVKAMPCFENIELNKEYDFNYWLDMLIKYYHPMDRKRLSYQYSLSNIIKHCNLGEHNIQETYRRFTGSSYAWISNNIIINNRSFSKDIAMIIQIDISDNYQKSNIIHALGSEYYCLYYVNLNDDTYEILRYEEAVKNKLKLAPEGCYSKVMRQYIDNFVHPDDIPTLENFTNIDNLKKSLGNRDNTISCNFRKKIDNHYEWVKMKYILSVLDNNHFVTLALKNIDETFRTEQNKNQLLQFTLDKAESYKKIQYDFISKISNDIRSPLTSIMGLTTLAKAHINNPEYIKDCLENISVYSQQLFHLINQMLDMNKIENNNFNLSLEEFRFSEFIRAILENVFKYIDEKNIEFTCITENVTTDNIIGDKNKLQQLVLNLLMNAINYNNVGGKIHLLIKQLPLCDKTISYQFIIKDTGIGISQEDIQNIFNPFTRGNDTRVQNISGTGLGLSIASNIAELMNGKIIVDSILNQGSTFTAIVNLSIKDVTPLNPKIYPNINVLVINNNELELKHICKSLNNMGINTTPMFPSKDVMNEIVLQHQNANDYFAVIIDKKIANIDYLKIIDDIHKYMGLKPLKILISSYEHITNHTSKNVFDFIYKPIFNSQITKTLDHLTESIQEYYYENPFDIKPLKNTNCLLIDNDINIKLINQEILKMIGSNVDTSSNNIESIKTMLLEKSYDYIVLNTNIPNDVIKSIVDTIHSINNIPIIATTSDYSLEKFSTIISMGINSHVIQPIDTNLNVLINCIISNLNDD